MIDKHSPGPWKIIETSPGVIDIFDARDWDIVTIYGRSEQKQADGRLIGAAPECFDALRATMRALSHAVVALNTNQRPDADFAGLVENARALFHAVLDKVEGEQI